MSKKNQKNAPKFQEYQFQAVTIEFKPVPTRGGRGYKVIGELEIQPDDDAAVITVEVLPGSPRFRPQSNVGYLCDVKVRWTPGDTTAKGRATPSRETLSLLSEQEWNPDVARANTVTLTFKRGNNKGGRPIAFFNGNPVFPERGSEVVLGQSRRYLLLERDGFRYHAVLADVGKSVRKENGKRGLDFVDLKVPKAKDKIAEDESDLEYTRQRKSVWELLALSKDTATEESVRAACEKKIRALGLGKNKPFILTRLGECFAEALEAARDQALEILGVKPEATEQQPAAEDLPDATDLVELEAEG